jgi:hypothetical protein
MGADEVIDFEQFSLAQDAEKRARKQGPIQLFGKQPHTRGGRLPVVTSPAPL